VAYFVGKAAAHGDSIQTANATDEKPIQVPPIPSSSSSKRKRALEDGEVVEDSDGGKGHGLTESKNAKPLDNPPTGEEQTEDSQRYDYRQFSSNYSGFGPSLATSDLKGMLDEAQQTMLMAWYQSGYATGRYQLLCELAEHGLQSNDRS
jgi:hypothetical protein